MPIEVTTPLQGEAVGPGTIIRASTFSVLPVGHHWDALVFEAGKQDELAQAITFNQGQSADFTLSTTTQAAALPTPLWARQPASAVSAGEFEMHVRVISAQSTIVDTSGPIGIVWKPDPAGVAYVQSLTTGGTTDGSFTESDRLTMGAIDLAVHSSISSTTIGGAAVSLALNQLLKGPPTDFLAQSPSFLLSGRGSVNRPGNGASLLAYGYRWFLESAPAGLGKENGYVVEYEQRLAQFALVRERLGGGEYVAQLENAHMESAEATWGLPFPLRVEYDILPGVVIRFAWLLLAQ